MATIKSIWFEYEVTSTFLTKLCASTPADPKIIAKWLEARKPKVIPAAGVFNVAGDMIGPLSLTGLGGKQICAALG